MKKNICKGCNRKIDSKFSYCPYCGSSIKEIKTKENYGFLGKDDFVRSNLFPDEAKLPFGLNKMVNSLMKQLEKELNLMNAQNVGNGFNVRVQTSNFPNIIKLDQKKEIKKEETISEEEFNRRQNLPKEEALSRIKRLSDKIIYEIETPGIQNKSQILIKNLEKGIEFKAYTKKICYTKIIPLKLKVDNYKIIKDKVLLEFKS
ncbi:MAG: hypothetical protein WC260_03075 [Candidatus Pacearchaeota archaeon]